MFADLFNRFFSSKSGRIYLDYAGSTPVDFSVVKEMENFQKVFSNPSGLYKESMLAKESLTDFRTRVAKVLNVTKNEVVFTSGGTEGNNMALLGTFEKFKTKIFTPHFITTSIEHSSTLEVCKEIERRGGEVTLLPVSVEGVVSVTELEKSLKDNTVLVSIGYANSEIGTIQPIGDVGKIIKDWKSKNRNSYPYLHVDGSGTSLYLSLDVGRLGVDLYTLDGAKIYGPKGVGCVFVKAGTEIRPIIFGGGQERGFRSGTENLVGIVGFTVALEHAHKDRELESSRLTLIRDYAIETILKNFPDSKINGSIKHRLPNNINICFKGLDAEFATIQLDLLGFSVSYSSSCVTLKDDSSSYVIRAIGGEECSKSSLRFTLGRDNTKKDIDLLILALKKVVK